MLHSVKRRVARILYPYGSVRRVLAGPIRGTKYVVEPGMGVSFSLGQGMNYDFLAQRVSAGMTVYDIGANRGQMALFFSNLVGTNGTVVSFEPVPSLFNSLDANLCLNQLDNVRPIQQAVSDETGQISFFFDPDRSTKGRLKKLVSAESTFEGEELTVDTTTIDSLIADGCPTPDVIKIDVEGGAEGVLAGAARLLTGAKPLIYIELHSRLEMEAIGKHLLSRSYVAESLSGRRINDPNCDPVDALWLYSLEHQQRMNKDRITSDYVH